MFDRRIASRINPLLGNPTSIISLPKCQQLLNKIVQLGSVLFLLNFNLNLHKELVIYDCSACYIQPDKLELSMAFFLRVGLSMSSL